MYLIFQRKIPLSKHLYIKTYKYGREMLFKSSIVIFITLKVIITLKMTFWKHRRSVWQKKTAVTYVSINLLIFHARDLSGIFKLIVYLCGNPWKPPVRFPRNFQCEKTRRIIGLTICKCGNSWKQLVRFPLSFQCREYRWNRRIDCFQVWKPSGNHIGVSP